MVSFRDLIQPSVMQLRPFEDIVEHQGYQKATAIMELRIPEVEARGSVTSTAIRSITT
jgi:hypothetical protein